MGNVYARIFRKREVRILIQGLDAAGKTTMLYRLKLGEVVTTIPTIGFNVETIIHKNVSITAWDVGGRDKIRPLYRNYYPNTDAVIFVVDSNDRERIDEVKMEITRVLDEDDLRDTCILVLANKQDLPNAMTIEEITEKLDLKKMKHLWSIFASSAKSGEGLHESLDWLVNAMANAHASHVVAEKANDIKASASASVYGLGNLAEKVKSFYSWFVPSKT